MKKHATFFENLVDWIAETRRTVQLNEVLEELAYWVGQFVIAVSRELTPEGLQKFFSGLSGGYINTMDLNIDLDGMHADELLCKKSR
ncbi:MAG: hypothetical protein HYT15_05105 [Candidatus Magasanikbacteria bacterium]|nr:hypothetical protein [Candidatus Magasanikbacteria bacterium]